MGRRFDRPIEVLFAPLLRSLDDTNRDVREEAAAGLAKRRDERVIPALRNMLSQADVSVRVCEAVAQMLGLEPDPPEWAIEDYAEALEKTFPADPTESARR